MTIDEKGKNRPWFKLPTRWGGQVEKLTDEQAGKVFKAIFDFINHDKEICFEENDAVLQFFAIDIDSWLKFECLAYINKSRLASKAGKASASARKEKNKCRKASHRAKSEQALTDVETEESEQDANNQTVSKGEAGFDDTGYDMADRAWFVANGKTSLLPKERAFLRGLIKRHKAEFICGCINELKQEKKRIDIESLKMKIAGLIPDK